MEKLIGLQSKLIDSLKSGHLIVLAVLILSLFAAAAPATAQAISTYQPSTYNAVYTSECRSSCATRSTNQNYGYGSSTYRGGYAANYGSNYGYGYGNTNYRNYNIGGMFAGYTPRIYSNYYGQRYYNYRQPSVGQYIGYYAGQYLQSRINNRGNCVSANSCVVNRAVSRPSYSISPNYDNGTQTYSNNQYQNGNMSYQDDSASASEYSNDSFNYTESPSAVYHEGSATYR